MVRFDQNRIVFEDEDNIDQYRVELLDTGELEIEYLPSGDMWKFENDGTLDADSLNVANYNDSAIDHDETSNRTHDGDDLSPATLEVDTFVDGAGISHSDELADSSDLYTDADASAAAPVQSVNGDTGSVSIEAGTIYFQEIEPSEKPSPPPAGGGGLWFERTSLQDSELVWQSFYNNFTVIQLASEKAENRTVSEDIYVNIEPPDDQYSTARISSDDGSTVWKFDLDFEPFNITVGTDYVFSAHGSRIVALDKQNGEQLWIDGFSGEVRSEIEFDADYVYAGTTADNFRAINKSDGSLKWENTYSNSAGGDIELDNDSVYHSVGGVLYSNDKTDGSVNWSLSESFSYRNGLALGSARLFAGADNDRVYALDPSDGTTLWESNTAGFIRDVETDENAVYVVAGSTLHSFDVASGSQNWSESLNDTGNEVLVSTDRIYVIDFGTELYAIDKTNGVVDFTITASNSFESLTISGDALYSTTTELSGDGSDAAILRTQIGDRSYYSEFKVSNGNRWVTQSFF